MFGPRSPKSTGLLGVPLAIGHIIFTIFDTILEFRLDFGSYFGSKFAYFSMFVGINFEASFFV